tara:strand:+ start:1810 stop:1986 length:177 start_codon:yes stop_codon:yes gene_type:complete
MRLLLDKVYKVIVGEQSQTFGRQALLFLATNALKSGPIDIALEPAHRYQQGSLNRAAY